MTVVLDQNAWKFRLSKICTMSKILLIRNIQIIYIFLDDKPNKRKQTRNQILLTSLLMFCVCFYHFFHISFSFVDKYKRNRTLDLYLCLELCLCMFFVDAKHVFDCFFSVFYPRMISSSSSFSSFFFLNDGLLFSCFYFFLHSSHILPFIPFHSDKRCST